MDEYSISCQPLPAIVYNSLILDVTESYKVIKIMCFCVNPTVLGHHITDMYEVYI